MAINNFAKTKKVMLNLRQLRKDNNLNQEEVAQHLGISRGYISLFEGGKTPLTNRLIDLIYDNAEQHWGWDISNFNPSYYRITKLVKALSEIHPELAPLDTVENNPFGAKPVIMKRIKYGKQELTPRMVEDIRHCFPECNADYLLYGEGSPISQTSPTMQKTENEEIQIRELYLCLKEVCENLKLLNKNFTRLLRQSHT